VTRSAPDQIPRRCGPPAFSREACEGTLSVWAVERCRVTSERNSPSRVQRPQASIGTGSTFDDSERWDAYAAQPNGDLSRSWEIAGLARISWSAGTCSSLTVGPTRWASIWCRQWFNARTTRTSSPTRRRCAALRHMLRWLDGTQPSIPGASISNPENRRACSERTRQCSRQEMDVRLAESSRFRPYEFAILARISRSSAHSPTASCVACTAEWRTASVVMGKPSMPRWPPAFSSMRSVHR
jgi:hypothetical protein